MLSFSTQQTAYQAEPKISVEMDRPPSLPQDYYRVSVSMAMLVSEKTESTGMIVGRPPWQRLWGCVHVNVCGRCPWKCSCGCRTASMGKSAGKARGSMPMGMLVSSCRWECSCAVVEADGNELSILALCQAFTTTGSGGLASVFYLNFLPDDTD